MKQLSTKPIKKNQKGQALVLITLSAAALMAFTGLGIDAANMYLRKAKLQAAIDAGTIAGITKLVARVSESADLSEQDISVEVAENIAKQVAAFNMKEMRLVEGSLDAIETQVNAEGSIDSNTRAITLDVSATISIKTLLLGVLTQLSSSVDATATGTGRRNPAIVSLVLDRSGSMRCNGGCPQKLEDMKTAAKSFVDSFVTNVDQMALISFNGVATVDFNMSVLTSSVKNNLKNAIDDINADGWTNISEGIELGRVAIETIVNANQSAAKDAVESIVLMTDGAPTTIRGNWQNVSTGGGPPLTPNTPGGDRIYYSLPYSNNFNDRMHDQNQANHACGRIRDCLEDFSYLDSKGNLQGFDAGGNVITDLFTDDDPMEVRKEMYDLSVIEAGYAKDFRNAQDPEDSGITMFVVGLGTPNGDAAADDPYEGVESNQTLKPILLRAIANVPDADLDTPFPYQASNYDPNQPEGLYLETPNSSELLELFLKIARRIQLRLVG